MGVRSRLERDPASPGGGIRARPPAGLTLRDLTFAGGTTDGDGGIASITSEVLRVERVRFEGGYADQSGGGLAWKADGVSAAAVIRDGWFRYNEAGYAGGGLSASGRGTHALQLENVTFEGNRAGSGGGGADLQTNDRAATDAVDILVSNSLFLENEAGGSGAGLAVGGWQRTELNVRDTLFSGNRAASGGGGAYVGGWEPIVDVWTRVRLEDNVSGSRTALSAWREGALALGSRAADTWTVDTCTFQRNTGLALNLEGSGSQSLAVLGGSMTQNSAGLLLDTRSTVSLVGVDLGTGGSDNTEYDIRWGLEEIRLDGVSTVRCDGSACR